MKVVHGSLSTLLQEVKDRKIDAVRVAAFVQSDATTNGMPRYTAWVVVTAVLDWDLWAEWRLLVGRGYAEVSERGVVVPPKIAEPLKVRAQEVRIRIADSGFGVRDGMLASDDDGMDGVLD
jgi:hypothetical protein